MYLILNFPYSMLFEILVENETYYLKSKSGILETTHLGFYNGKSYWLGGSRVKEK